MLKKHFRSIFEYFCDSPPPMPATVSKPIPRFFSHILIFLLVRPVHVDVIVNASLSYFFFPNLAACSGKYSSFSVPCYRRFGGGDIVETLFSSLPS